MCFIQRVVLKNIHENREYVILMMFDSIRLLISKTG